MVMEISRATGKYDEGAPVVANENGYEYDATATRCCTSTDTTPKPNAAATSTSTEADATATEFWVWDANAIATWWHGPAGTKHTANVQHGTDGWEKFFLTVRGRVC